MPSSIGAAVLPKTELFLQVGRTRYQVQSFEQASKMFCAARDKSGLGASGIPFPLIVDQDGKTVGYVAYNGRVFAGSPQAWVPGTAILFDNRGS